MAGRVRRRFVDDTTRRPCTATSAPRAPGRFRLVINTTIFSTSLRGFRNCNFSKKKTTSSVRIDAYAWPAIAGNIPVNSTWQEWRGDDVKNSRGTPTCAQLRVRGLEKRNNIIYGNNRAFSYCVRLSSSTANPTRKGHVTRDPVVPIIKRRAACVSVERLLDTTCNARVNIFYV